MSQELQEWVRRETTALHDFFTGWFAGTMANQSDIFEAGFTRWMAPGFINIQPAGKVLARDDLIDAIRLGYGNNPDFQISIENVRIHQQFPDGLVLATYEELQHGALNSSPTNRRLSSVLMKPHQDRALWFWVHETWLPDQD